MWQHAASFQVRLFEMPFTLPYAVMLLPVIACGGALSTLLVDMVRREDSKQRVERALLAFWMCMAVLMSTHFAETSQPLVVSL